MNIEHIKSILPAVMEEIFDDQFSDNWNVWRLICRTLREAGVDKSSEVYKSLDDRNAVNLDRTIVLIDNVMYSLATMVSMIFDRENILDMMVIKNGYMDIQVSNDGQKISYRIVKNFQVYDTVSFKLNDMQQYMDESAIRVRTQFKNQDDFKTIIVGQHLDNGFSINPVTFESIDLHKKSEIKYLKYFAASLITLATVLGIYLFEPITTWLAS